MTPCVSADNSENSTFGNAVFKRNFTSPVFVKWGSRGVFEPYFFYHVFRNLGAAIKLACIAWPSSFFYGIVTVIQCCSNKKMNRIHARRVVAMMTNHFPIWNFTDKHLIGNAMGYLGTWNSETSVSFWIFSCNPNPAWPKFGAVFWNWAVFINLLPKALCRRFLSLMVCIHAKKTPANSEVKPAQCVRQRSQWVSNWDSLLFAAALRPEQTY